LLKYKFYLYFSIFVFCFYYTNYVLADTIVLNEATGLSCDQVCENLGSECIDMGNNEAADNNHFWWCIIPDGCVNYGLFSDCTTTMSPSRYACEGKNAFWTNCLCSEVIPPPPPSPANEISHDISIIDYHSRTIQTDASTTETYGQYEIPFFLFLFIFLILIVCISLMIWTI
jgi:Ca2+/Na+ antiporter